MDQNFRINTNCSDMKDLFYNSAESFLKKYHHKNLKIYLDEKIVGQQEAKKAAATLLWEHVHKVRFDKSGTYKKQNLLFIGPSGCGKTEIMRQLQKISPVNITIFDASSITPEGWKGDVKIQSIGEKVLSDCIDKCAEMSRLVSAEKSMEMLKLLTNTSIVVLDEFDKVIRPTNNNDNSSASIMGEMLKIFEDGTYKAATDINSKAFTIDYSRIPIIALGAFSDLTSPVETPKTVGFGNNTIDDQETSENKEFTTEDLIKYGMTHELAGRIQNIITLSPLSKEDMISIIRNNHACINEYKDLLHNFYGIELRFTAAAYEDIAEVALKSQTGARALETCLFNIKERIIWEVPSDSIVTITSHNTFEFRQTERSSFKIRSKTF